MNVSRMLSIAFLRIYKPILLILGMCFGVIGVIAQENPPVPAISEGTFAYFSTNNATPKLGETFTLTLTLQSPANITVDNWVQWQEVQIAPLEIIEEGEITTNTTPQGTIITQELEAVLWAVGSYLSPELSIDYTQNGSPNQIIVQSTSLVVPSMLTESFDQDLRPSVSPIDLAFLPVYVVIVIILVLSIVVYGIWRLLKRRQGRIAGIFGGDATQVLIAELEDLAKQSPTIQMLYLLIAEKLRGYTQARMGINATEMTTNELKETLNSLQLIDKKLTGDLINLLTQADLVKFAKFTPDVNPNQVVQYAIRWVKNVSQALKDNAND
jgi:hypothetical protein